MFKLRWIYSLNCTYKTQKVWMQVLKCKFCHVSSYFSHCSYSKAKFVSNIFPVYSIFTFFLYGSCMYSSLYILSANVDYVWTCTGTFAVVSLMTGTVVEQLVPTPELNCSSPEVAELEDQRIGVASAIAFLSGVMMVWKYLIYDNILYTWHIISILNAY